MDICSVADRNYLRHYATLLASIAHNNAGRGLRFHLVTDGIDGPDAALFNDFCARKEVAVEVHLIDANAVAADLDSGRLAKSTYYRMLIPELLRSKARVLYLDVDMVVTGPIDELLSTDISGFGAGVVRAHFTEQRLAPFGVSDEAYFNAGMMLMNLDYWREHRIAEQALRFAAEHPSAIVAADQCALNFALRDQVMYVDPKWNCSPANAKRYTTLTPTIIHYAGRTKPWERPWRTPYGIYYANYSQLTPWPMDYFGSERRERGLRGLVLRARRRFWSRSIGGVLRTLRLKAP